jgi:hypothetical protein
MEKMAPRDGTVPSPLVGEGREGVLKKLPPSRLTSFAGLPHKGGGNWVGLEVECFD